MTLKDKTIPLRYCAEKRDLEFFHRRLIHDSLINNVVFFNGRLDMERLEKAIRLSIDAEPILGCRFVESFPRPCWERRQDLDRIRWCRLIETDAVDREIDKFLIKPIKDLYNEPHVQFLVIRSHVDTLCIKINHMLLDGGGNFEYISIISNIYRKLEDDPSYTPPINAEGSRALSQVYNRLNLKEKVQIIPRAFRQWKRDSFPPDNWTSPFHEGDPNDRAFVFKDISPEQFNALKAYGKHHKVSMNDIIITGFFHALKEMINPPKTTPLRLVMVVDVRRYLSSGKGGAVCNLAGLFQLNMGQKLGDHFDQDVLTIRDRMLVVKNKYIGLSDYFYMFYSLPYLPYPWVKTLNNWFFALNSKLGPTRKPPGFSNAGMIDPDVYDFGDPSTMDVKCTGPILPHSFFFPTITCFENSLRICFGFTGAEKNKPIVETFFSILLKKLPI